MISLAMCPSLDCRCVVSYHFRSLCARYGELEVGILLPVAKEQGKFAEKAVVDTPESGDGLGTRVPVNAAF